MWRSLVARFVRDEEVVGSNPATPTIVKSRDVLIGCPGTSLCPGVAVAGFHAALAWGSLLGPRWESAGLVVAVGVGGEFSEDLAGGGVHDDDVAVVDEQPDRCAGELAADADVVQATGPAQGDGPVGVDLVLADPEVAAVVVLGGGLGSGGVGARRGGAVEGAVRAVGVVVVGKRVELVCRVLRVAARGRAVSQRLRVWLSRSTLPWVWGWFGLPFFWAMPRSASSVSNPLGPPRKRVVKTIPLSVRVD